jgi:alkylation response protein AidB-like acyl-CoA dehydrogenase
MKAYTTETRRDLGRVAAELAGPDALDSARTLGGLRRGTLGSLEDYFSTFGNTISAGSSEIQRNIIAERVLGLPRS